MKHGVHLKLRQKAQKYLAGFKFLIYHIVMLRAYRLTSPVSSEFGDAWKLYKTAFPLDERRPLRCHAEAMQQEPAFHCYAFYEVDSFIGLLFYWEFSTCVYVEHLAVETAWRAQGYGSQILHVARQHNKPVILEIEPVTDATTELRLHFYQKTGYHLLTQVHYQLPYHRHDNALRLLLLSYPRPASQELIDSFEQEFSALPMRYRQTQEP